MPDPDFGRGVTSGEMRGDLRPNRFDTHSANTGPQQYALGFATVTRVDYESFKVTLRVETGEEFLLDSPLVFPGAGYRVFLGSLPQIGDICLIGWGMRESGATRAPYILGWIIPGSTAGHDWLPTQPYGPGELGFSPSDKAKFEGVADRIRHKLRHMEPGHIVASSAQGADLVLNESVQLMNRRGNEIHLRDQDQAIIFRSLQEFHAQSGTRVYSGMVQRDANLLPTQMFSDGVDWDSPRQVDAAGRPLGEDELMEDVLQALSLTPAEVFQRDRGGSRGNDLNFGSLDPYNVLPRGLFIASTGQAIRDTSSDAVYGGKPYFRVAADGSGNSAIDTNVDTLTEYRIEVAHTSDGTLPVTEQTDGFDADRLPDAVPQDSASPLSGSDSAPFIEFVLGSVVGNDPFSTTGRDLYGLPLRPSIFEGDDRAPGLASGFGFDINTHAAAMFRLRPPLSVTATPSFWAMTKDGRALLSVAGPGDTYSAEMAFASGVKMGLGATPSGQSYTMLSDGAISLRSARGNNEANIGVNISSDQGAVHIYGGGASQEGGIAARTIPTGDGESGLPSVKIEAATNLELRAARKIKLAATELEFTDINALTLSGQSGVNIRSGEKVSTSTKVIETTSLGKVDETFSGPKDSLPTNMPVRSTTFAANPATGSPGGPTDQYSMLFGDRLETFTAGNHTTMVAVGNQNYVTGTGTVNIAAGTNTVNVSNAGIQVAAAAGAVTLSAVAGAVSIQASTAVAITAGTNISLAAASVAVQGPHTPPGGVLTDGCTNPFTGTPFSASGTLGVPTFRVGV